MRFGGDFFKMFNFAIAIMRLFSSIFGDADDKKSVEESRARTKDGNPDNAC